MSRIYTLTGLNPADKTRYQGKVSLTQTGAMTWNVEVTVAGDFFEGYAIGDGDTLSVMYQGTGSVAFYKLRPDGAYDGIWAVHGATEVGTESWTPI